MIYTEVLAPSGVGRRRCRASSRKAQVLFRDEDDRVNDPADGKSEGQIIEIGFEAPVGAVGPVAAEFRESLELGARGSGRC